MKDAVMLQETRDAPGVLERQHQQNATLVRELARVIKARDPLHVMTLARGSSDHACTVLKYAVETTLGLSVSSAAPSVHTLYRRPLRLSRALVVAVSQSGASPDIVESVQAAREAGATTVALVNVETSDLARAAEFVLPLRAGEERAVAATKSFLASLSAGLDLIAALSGSDELSCALDHLPGVLEETLAVEATVRERAERYRFMSQLVTLGRGAHFGVAQEAALKFKETSGIAAEAFSSAEFMHGPVRVIEPGFPVLAFQARDATAAASAVVYAQLHALGAELLLIGAEAGVPSQVHLRTVPTSDPIVDVIPSAAAMYLFAGHLALARGLDPDAPPKLRKVTLTR